MSAKTLAKLRALPLAEVERRMNNAVEQGKHGAFWRYYFEIALRKLEARTKLIREATGQSPDFMEPEPEETNDSNETGNDEQGETLAEKDERIFQCYRRITQLETDSKRLDWLQNEALGASVNATLDDLVGKGWTSIRAAIDKAKSQT